MWNHAQNSYQSGDEDTTNEADVNSGLKDRIERSLDLTQYLKYLDQLFNQSTSESESSDSEDGEINRSRTFTDFVQPPAHISSDRCLPPPPYSQNHIIIGTSNVAENNHLSNCTALKSSDNFHLEANISSSSLSSIDSGTSSLSLNYSSETFSETTLAKAEEAASAVQTHESGNGRSPSLCADSNSSTPVIEDDKAEQSGSDKNKKSQKKKKAAKGSNETISRQNKPSSGGKGNGSKGGGGGGGSSASGSSGSTANSSNSTGSTNSQSKSYGGSSGAKTRSGEQNLQAFGSEMASNLCLHQPIAVDHLNSVSSNTGELILDSDITENFSPATLNGSSDEGAAGVTFESHGINAYPVTALLDIQDEENENSLSDYISMTTPTSTLSTDASVSSPVSQSSTSFFSKIAAAAASSAFFNYSRKGNCFGSTGGQDQISNEDIKCDASGKKRKIQTNSGKSVKLTEKQKQNRINVLNAKRKKIYVSICKKEIGKTQRSRINTFKESLAMKRKLAHACARHLRKNALQSQKCMKESVCKAKRLTQEMELYWKMAERMERDLQRRKEKEAEEKFRKDSEILNKIMQQRKLNKLVTQTELFASKLLNPQEISDTDDILRRLEEVKDERVAYLDNYDSDQAKISVQTCTDRALKDHLNLVRVLDMSGLYLQNEPAPSTDGCINEISQPQIFEGVLNSSQIYEMGWLFRMYSQGLNGMFLDNDSFSCNKQIIAFISYLAESCGLWGPFLIVTSGTMMQKWQLDFDRLSPRFKIFPYLGKPVERKILRQFWGESNIHTENARFHVVVTTHQVMASDLKYIGKVKWQYLIMDDTQGTITSSTKWMTLLSFQCRTKLLLSSHAQLDSLSHLCSYLYFIMPSLFDSQEEFSEWLLKELESLDSDKKCHLNKKIIERLRSVVQHFLLDHEQLSIRSGVPSNIDIHLYCSPSRRQKQLCSNLLEKFDMHSIVSNLEKCPPEEVQNRIKTVLNYTALMRKVCNHPGLVEDRNMSSNYRMKSFTKLLPQLIYKDRLHSSMVDVAKRLFCIYSPKNIHSSFFHGACHEKGSKVTKTNTSELPTWSFARILDLSYQTIQDLYTQSICARLSYLVNFESVLERIYYETVWKKEQKRNILIQYPEHVLYHSLSQSQVLSNLVFVTSVPYRYYTWKDCKYISVPNTIEHRRLRLSTALTELQRPALAPEIDQAVKKVLWRHLPVEYPIFLNCYVERVLAEGIKAITASDRIDQEINVLENRLLLSDVNLDNTTEKDKAVASRLIRNLTEMDWFPIKNRNSDHFILDSGKLHRLDGLLNSLTQSRTRILICSYGEATLQILKQFLEIRKWDYISLENRALASDSSDSVIYLLDANRPIFNASKISVDTVVFFDQDWRVTLDEEKRKIISNLECPDRVDCYRLICRGTIEERVVKLAKEQNIPTSVFCKDAVGSLNGSSIPSLKGLFAALVGENDHQMSFDNLTYGSCPHSEKGVSQQAKWANKSIITRELVTSRKTYCEDKGLSDAVIDNVERIIGYVNDTRDSDSSSPSCSEELDPNEVDLKGCTEDHFHFNMDESYMGLSPDSFESIKSDYEEDSSPRKYRLGRGTGKRGRPPSRIRFQKHDLVDSSHIRRGPGRPRLKTAGPLNQGMRGRKPGRPPLTKKAETISSALAPLSSSQRVFGFYSSPDLELS